MHKKQLSIIFLMALVAISQATAAGKKLKIYILAGQSNMQGKAQLHTVPRMALSPKTKALHDKIVDEEGKPRVHKNVSIVYFTGGDLGKGYVPRELKEVKGHLSTGFGGAIGPELGFGITMDDSHDGPILIIKTAWGGRSLFHHFRPPSAGVVPFKRYGTNKPVTEEGWKAREKGHYDTQGLYYKLILKLVNKVLADPSKYCAAYDPKQGYEIAGFAWFQGFNDGLIFLEGSYDHYTKNLTHFIKDIRKDLKVPKMPFIIGVIGIGGEKVDKKAQIFRKAMAAVADVPEFKGNVVAVPTAQFWDYEVEDAANRAGKSKKMWKTSEAWRPVGQPKFEDREWRYTSFPLDVKDQYKVYNKWHRKFLDSTPKELKDWLKPDFDTNKWQKGPAPIGKGKEGQRALKPDEAKLLRSTMGKGDILLMKTTFKLERDDISHFRLCVRNSSSYKAYINGQLVKNYDWYNSPKAIRKHDIDAKAVKVGVNELAVYTNIKEVKGFGFNAVDCYLEGMTKTDSAELIKRQTETAPPKAYELIKGKSNQAFHYLGSAYTYSQIGEALAKSLISLDKAAEN